MLDKLTSSAAPSLFGELLSAAKLVDKEMPVWSGWLAESLQSKYIYKSQCKIKVTLQSQRALKFKIGQSEDIPKVVHKVGVILKHCL